jgi:hypothetical protein
MIPLINVETLISDFNFKFGGKKEVNFVVLHRLLSSKDKDYEIFEKFKEKNSKAYDSIVSNLSSYEDVVSSKVDGVYIYDVTNEIIEKLSKHKGSSILDVGNNKLMKMISKPEISDTFEDDILKFYDTFCADMSVAEVIRSEYFVNIKKDVDTLNIQLPKRWPSNFSFNIPLSEFYEAWEKSKETYMDYLSYDIWSAFKVSFEETFGFRKNLKTDQYTFDFVIRGRELFINPFKLWALQQLWEVDMDSYSFTKYIIYYFVIRDYNMLIWDVIEFGDSLSYIMERPIIKLCSKYRNLSKSE